MNKTFYTFLLSLLLLSGLVNAQKFVSTDALSVYNTSITGLKQGSVAPIDFDKDGNTDLFISGYDALFNSYTKLLYNTGTDFNDISAFITFPGVGRGKIAVGDVNNDTYPDFFITGEKTTPSSTLIAKLFTNSGSNFTEVQGTPFVGVYDGDAAFADVNNDGFMDLLIIGDETLGNGVNTAKLYTNSGTNFALVSGTPFTGAKIGALAFADVNNDTYQDVIITGLNAPLTPITKLYTNSGTNFTEVASTPFPAVSGSKVAFLDANGDTKPDVFIMGLDNSFTSVSKLYTNSGASFTEVPTPAISPLNSGTLEIADFNNDGKPDIYLSGGDDSFNSAIALYTNTGGNFALAADTPFGNDFTETIAVAFDINKDGKQDIFATGSAAISGDNLAKIYLNDIVNTQIIIQPSSATVCGGALHTFSVTASGTGLTYAWSNGATTQNMNTSVAGTYFVTVSGAGGIVVSNAASLTQGVPTAITSVTSGVGIFQGNTADLNVLATGTQLSYLWSTGATTANVSGVGAGEYFVTVTGACGVKTGRSLVGNIIPQLTFSGYTPVTKIDNQLNYPFEARIASDDRIYITNELGHSVSVWVKNGNTHSELTTFGSYGSGLNQFNQPNGIAIGSDGRVYIADAYNHRISVWTPNGNTYTPLITFGSQGSGANQFDVPAGITIGSDGKIYVTDSENSRISVWTQNGNTYTPLTTFGSGGSGANQLNRPFGISIGTDGKIFVADYLNHRISVWTQNGNTYTPLTTFGTEGTQGNQLSGPVGITSHTDGKLYIADSRNNRISVWTQNGNNFTHSSTFGTYGSGTDQLNFPTRVSLTSNGNIYIADQYNSRVSIWKVPALIFYFTAVFEVTAPATFTGSTATLTWPTITGATTYCLKISKDKSFGASVKTVCGLTGNSYSYNPNAPGGRQEESLEEYYFQVAGVDSAGNYSQWSETQTFMLDATATSIADAVFTQVQIYPNPVEGNQLTIENAPAGETISILNVQGIEVRSQKAVSGITQVDVSGLGSGVYVVKMKGKVTKLVKR